WKKPDYIPNANLDYILKFLVNHGKHELVGAFFRNDRLAEYEEAPDSYLDVYHLRNRDEGFNGYLKNILNIENSTRGKYKDKVDLYTTLSLAAILAVALTKLQHGITRNLSSTAYLT
ncbi:MAG: hypothetical protein AB1485_05350, partial [Candidatus Thermoplasmatota archaeon]